MWLSITFLGFSNLYFFTFEKVESSEGFLKWLQTCEIVSLGALFKFGTTEKVPTLPKLYIKLKLFCNYGLTEFHLFHSSEDHDYSSVSNVLTL